MSDGDKNDRGPLINLLRGALLQHASEDVLMPAPRGEKHPMFPHAGGRWTWQAYDSAAATVPDDADLGVLLQRLVVVDVDTADAAAALEARFPALLDAPAERTKRGMHYWFRRSERMDRDGFYDGAAQVASGIDLKTRCASGSGGFVVVAPSAGKAWVRAPWDRDDGFPVMPDDLLEAVGRAKHPSRTMTFSFDDGEVATLDARRADAFAYFDAFLDGSIEAGAAAQPVPCDRAGLEAALRLVQEGERAADVVCARDPSLLRRALAVADKLGLDVELEKRLRAQVLAPALWARDLWTLAPDMARALLDVPRDACVALTDDDAIQCERPTALLRSPLRLALFRGRPEGPPKTAVSAGAVSAAAAALPPAVWRVMRRWPDALVLAGGAALGLLAPALADAGADWDLFVHSLDEQRATDMLRAIEADELTADRYVVFRTPRAWTFVPRRRDEPRAAVVQIVLRLHESPHDVLASFDLAPCRVALRLTPDGGAEAFAHPSWLVAVRHGAFPVDLREWNRASVARVLKYVAKGLDAYLPGLRRDDLSPTAKATPPRNGIGGLLWAERHYDVRGRRPVLDADLAWVVRQTRSAWSNYEDDTKLSRRFGHVLAALARKGAAALSRFFGARAQARRCPLVLWHRSRDVALTPRTCAGLGAVHDGERYAARGVLAGALPAPHDDDARLRAAAVGIARSDAIAEHRPALSHEARDLVVRPSVAAALTTTTTATMTEPTELYAAAHAATLRTLERIADAERALTPLVWIEVCRKLCGGDEDAEDAAARGLERFATGAPDAKRVVVAVLEATIGTLPQRKRAEARAAFKSAVEAGVAHGVRAGVDALLAKKARR